VYREYVVPRLVNWACGAKWYHRWRAEAAAGLSGRVVEVGFGSGLNLAHYPPDLDVVLAIEPASVARRPAERRIRDAPMTVQHLRLDGQQIPLDDASCDGCRSPSSSARCPTRTRRWPRCGACCVPGERCTSWSTACPRTPASRRGNTDSTPSNEALRRMPPHAGLVVPRRVSRLRDAANRAALCERPQAMVLFTCGVAAKPASAV
jgi:hypothetical protein